MVPVDQYLDNLRTIPQNRFPGVHAGGPWAPWVGGLPENVFTEFRNEKFEIPTVKGELE